MPARNYKRKEKPPLPEWTLNEARELYNVRRWGGGYFDVNAKGHVCVHPHGTPDTKLDILDLIEELSERGIDLPVQVRLTDILRHRVRDLNECFRAKIAEYQYGGQFFGVFPIKVNQHRQVIEEIVEAGRDYNYGLEAGTKPELLLAISQCPDDGLIICNGYKDDEYIETALRAARLGKKVFIVVEKLSEVPILIRYAKELDIVPNVGVRVKLHSRGRGKWEGSGGDRAKFGLFVFEILEMLRLLREAELIEGFKLLHFHLGSQITDIRQIKKALREGTRIYAELVRLGVPLQFMDVGGGLAVDYDGSHTNFASSSNYGMEEYAADVIEEIQKHCKDGGVPEPNVIAEAGRAMVAHHAFLLVEVLGAMDLLRRPKPMEIPPDAPPILQSLKEVAEGLTSKNHQETFHDALAYRDEGLQMFNLGLLNLEQRSMLEGLFYGVCQAIYKISSRMAYIPDELQGLEKFLADTYFANFSVFKSIPDHWAIRQLFPVMPVHRLRERPTHRGTIADLTCDSDGKIDQFINLRDVNETLELHPFSSDEPYYLGVFLTGAYQEVLGDFHNLFGDTNTVHISVLEDGSYEIDRFLPGDSVEEVLSYVGYDRGYLLDKVRIDLERSARAGKHSLQEAARFRKLFMRGLEGYTYLEGENED